MQISSLKQRLAFLIRKPAFIPLFLLLISLMAYGLLIPWLHLYVDDWIWIWTWEKMGPAGITNYFATHRPVWGLFFQVSLPLFGKNILAYHLFALLIRWASSLAFWWLLRLLFPKHASLAFSGALLFLIYPGFALQPIAITYSHLFLIYSIFLLSLAFNLLALRAPHAYRRYTFLAVLLSLVNLLTMEYFFTLELARPLLTGLLSAEAVDGGRARRVKWTLRQWLPYLGVFLGVGILRAFFFKSMTQQRFQYTLPGQFLAHPLAALVGLFQTILISFWEASFGAWLPAIRGLSQLNWRLLNSQLTFLLAAAAAVAVFGVFRLAYRQKPGGRPEPERDGMAAAEKTPAPIRGLPLRLIVLGLLLMLAAGWPFWLTSLRVYPVHYNSRFTIPFMFGVVLLFMGLLELLHRPVYRAAILAVLVGTACGYHFQIANTFRLDWEQNRQLMWQIAWRIPRMQEGTTLLITDFPVTYYDTATMATELNAIYPAETRFPDLGTYILYDREQDELLRPQGLRKGVELEGSNITSEFHGTTSQVLSAEYNLSRCFRLLDPALDAKDSTLAEFTRRAVKISSWDWVRADLPAAVPPAELFGSAPTGQWCYYFEKAELARQTGDWQTAARLGDEARQNGLPPRDEMEKLVFIEAYAHTAQWERAVEISESFQPPDKLPMLCLVWERIAASTPSSAEKTASLNQISQPERCPELPQNGQ